MGVEPTVEQILSLLCLPIPPRGHKNGTATENRTPINEMKTRCTNRYTIAAEMAPRPGFEPRLDESKSSVLPLHNQGKVVDPVGF